jgi:hypothetical protein
MLMGVSVIRRWVGSNSGNMSGSRVGCWLLVLGVDMAWKVADDLWVGKVGLWD